MDASVDGIDRRRYLSTLATFAGVTATTGCVAWEQTGATDIRLYSLAADPLTVSVVITGANTTDPHTSRTLSVSQGETIDSVNRGKLPTNTSYTVAVAIEEGASETFDWTDPTLDLAPLHVLIEDPQTIEFLYNTG